MNTIQRYGTKLTYSEAVIHNKTVYLSGQVPWLTAGQSIYEQASEVFELIDKQLEQAGSNRTQILSLQIFLKNPEDYSEMNRAFIMWMPDGSAPARNTICGVQFPTADWGLEVVVVAALI